MKLGFLWLSLLAAACTSTPTGAPPPGGAVLIFSHTTGYRHESIGVGRPALEKIVQAEGREAVLSEDPAIFSAERLRGFGAIILLSTTTLPKKPESEWLTGTRRDALRTFVRSGGGIVAVHAAADSHYHWPWYGKLIGGYFERHPQGTPTGRLKVVDGSHPSTRGLPAVQARPDEWYYFAHYDPSSRLLITLDPGSIGEKESNPQPISWARKVEGGRVFYTALGHTPESYSDPYFIQHVRGGLRWALRKD